MKLFKLNTKENVGLKLTLENLAVLDLKEILENTEGEGDIDSRSLSTTDEPQKAACEDEDGRQQLPQKTESSVISNIPFTSTTAKVHEASPMMPNVHSYRQPLHKANIPSDMPGLVLLDSKFCDVSFGSL